MKIYYSKYPIYPFDFENKTMGVIEDPYKDIQEKIFYNKPQVKETDFRSGKERRRDPGSKKRRTK